MNSSHVSVTRFSQCPCRRRRILDYPSIRIGISAFVCLLLGWSVVAQTPLTISNIRLDSSGRAIVSVPAVPGSYFILYRGDTVAAISTVTDLESDPTLAAPQQVELNDELPLIPTARFYRVEKVSLASPKDSDSDGMDDAYELAYRPVLNPLNAADADLDSDNDGRTNVEEYRARTNPLVANPPPAPASPILDPIAESTQGTLLSLSGSGPVNTTIRVEGAAFLATNSVGADGHFSVPVVLSPNRLNRLLISAIGTNGSTSAGQPVEIIQDSQPPTLFVDFPTNNQAFFSTNTMVAGRVGDSLSGYRGLRVWVHSSPSDGDAPLASTQFPVNSPFAATVDVGIGPNGTFERGSVPLALGANIITVIGSDLLGNRTLRRTEVTRLELAGPRIIAVDGDRQIANAARTLSAPIIVRVTQSDGSPIANSTLVFDVTRSNGRLRPVNDAQLASPWTNSPSATTNGAMQVRLKTDAAGEARVWWTLGSDAGCANNRVCVTSMGISNNVFFCASATPNAARQLNIGSGNNQKVEVGAQTPEPLRVWASDGLNPAVAAPITFRVVQGGGKLIPGGRDGTPQPLNPSPSTELTVAAGITGHASVGFIAGPDGGQNLIEATFPGQFGLPATFTVYGVARDLDTPGTFSGLILDNTSCPIGNATARLTVANYDRIVMSDGQGQFRFPDVPGGMGHLFVNGATATSLFNMNIPTNSFPALSYAVVTVANAQNSLPTPVLLPRLDPVNAKTYYGTNDITLTCKGIDGLKFTIQANSMRHPDGARVTPDRPAVVSLNQVHHDNIPMPMPDGVAPPFAWTFQPGGAHFDIERPVKVEYPNMSGLAAGSIAYFLSFNHDTERFEIAASGHVTEDGSTILTDPGSGLTISGWGCNCPPYSVTGKCKDCTPKPNGCGTGRIAKLGLLNTFTIYDPELDMTTVVDFTGACGKHDIAYGTIGTSKEAADAAFFKDLTLAYKKATIPGTGTEVQAAARAALYYEAVVGKGKDAYETAQRETKLCLESGDTQKLASIIASRLGRVMNDTPVPQSLMDQDGDLIPDDWEIAHGMKPNDLADALEDPDHDGLNNLTEFISGTDPHDVDTAGDGLGDYAKVMSIQSKQLPELDDTWSLTVSDQTVKATVIGTFSIPNISAPDQFGAGGAGSRPDFLSDDYVRLIGHRSTGGSNLYVFSEFFQILQGGTITITNLTFTDIPPRKPEALSIICTNQILRLGQNAPLTVLARFADGTITNVAPRTSWTSYRVSNPNIARVSPDGVVTPLIPGTVYVTAVNEGASAVCGLNVVDGADGLTTVVGTITDTNGVLLAGTVVKLYGLANTPVLSDASGHFMLTNVPTTLGPISVLATNAAASVVLSGAAYALEPGPSGFTDAGTLVLHGPRTLLRRTV